MIKLRAQQGSIRTISADLIAYIVFENDTVFKRQTKDLKTLLKDAFTPMESSGFRGKEQEVLLLYPRGFRTKKFLLVGGGKTKDLTREKLRRISAAVAKSAQTQKAKSLAIMEPEPETLAGAKSDFGNNIWNSIGLALGEGAALSQYQFDKYFTIESKKKQTLREVTVVAGDKKRAAELSAGLKGAALLCESAFVARDLENAPGNEIYPETLAQRVREIGEEHGFSVTVLDEKKIRELKMGGLLGVSQGSDKPPRFIIMEHNAGNKTLPTIVFVGKGVTFDSGGISIKPAANMAEMKMDMSGAAAVVGTMKAATALKLPVHLVGLIPATENLLGGSALKPGDVITHLNGKTSEVDNTDAEGRLILADALSFASKYNPDVVIDLATLTGACVVALGHHATGMMGNDQPTMDALTASGNRTYERVWQLPMFQEYEKQIKSDIADVKNVGGRWGGAITAALFLKQFIGEYKWVHLDIAGTAIIEEASDYIPKGGSGVGVRLLIDFLQHWIESHTQVQ